MTITLTGIVRRALAADPDAALRLADKPALHVTQHGVMADDTDDTWQPGVPQGRPGYPCPATDGVFGCTLDSEIHPAGFHAAHTDPDSDRIVHAWPTTR